MHTSRVLGGVLSFFAALVVDTREGFAELIGLPFDSGTGLEGRLLLSLSSL